MLLKISIFNNKFLDIQTVNLKEKNAQYESGGFNFYSGDLSKDYTLEDSLSVALRELLPELGEKAVYVWLLARESMLTSKHLELKMAASHKE